MTSGMKANTLHLQFRAHEICRSTQLSSNVDGDETVTSHQPVIVETQEIFAILALAEAFA